MPDVAASEFCGEVVAADWATAAEIISAVSSACGINPQVLIVTLQKEAGLVTASGPTLTTNKYIHATGAGCPDFAQCDPSLESFFLQVYGAAERFSKYRAHPENYNYRPGPVQMQYSPEISCGKASFTIKNQATAGLYNYYTPYVPNDAALANPTGEGDGCSSYGNRNFYRLMRAWFPESAGDSTAAPILPSPPSSVSPGVAAVSTEVDRVGGVDTLGNELSQTTCTSTTTGPCTKKFEFGTVTWSSAAGAHTALDGALPSTWSRWAGDDRYATSAAVSANTFSPKPDVAFIAYGENFADALAGGAAAHASKAPLLLTQSDTIPSATSAELKRLAPRRIVVLGGPDVVSDAVLNGLGAYTSGGVTRLAGDDRYATAVAISKAALPSTAAHVTVASGTAFPDALSAANLLSTSPGPILLSGPTGLDAATLAEVKRLGAPEAAVVGGPDVVPDATVNQLDAAGANVTRLSGEDRFETNAEVGQFAYDSASHVYLASGVAFPDGLTAGPPAALEGAPLLLVNSSCIPATTARFLTTIQPGEITLLGGTDALSDKLKTMPLC